jgi:hypothetical protein
MSDLGAIQIQILPILKAAGVRRAAIFGSLARGEATDESDVDLLVDLPDRASLLDLVGLKLDLEDKLGRKVDVVEYDALKPLLRDRILNEQITIL